MASLFVFAWGSSLEAGSGRFGPRNDGNGEQDRNQRPVATHGFHRARLMQASESPSLFLRFEVDWAIGAPARRLRNSRFQLFSQDDFSGMGSTRALRFVFGEGAEHECGAQVIRTEWLSANRRAGEKLARLPDRIALGQLSKQQMIEA
jgi:hypothetical protein